LSLHSRSRLLGRCSVLVALLAGVPAGAQIQFEDVSADAGLTGGTESWGISWGDLNADGWPDAFHQGHRDYPRVYRNTGTGVFQDIAYEVDPGQWIAEPFTDQHGVAFADFDNDGDDDLLISVSGGDPAEFLVNENGDFINRSVESGLANNERARHSVWFDYTGDGLLDVAQFHTMNAILRFRDPADPMNPQFAFSDELAAGFDCTGRMNYGQLIDFDADGSMELICIKEGPFPARIWDTSVLPFTDRTSELPVIGNVNDTAMADLNNDLLADIILSRGALRRSGAVLVDPNRVEGWLRKSSTTPAGKGFLFESNGEISVTIDRKNQGIFDDPAQFTLSPAATTSVDAGAVRVEWLAAETRWRVWLTADTAQQAYIQIDTVEPVTNLVEEQFDNPEFAQEINYLENSPTGWSRRLDSGLELEGVFCSSVVAADFDNDMDQDLYLVCGRGPENLRNRVYENQGDGTFVEVLSHGGEGPQGVGFEFGVGDSVSTADYDVDGYMDLFVTNGVLIYPAGVGGPDTLLRNLGSGNNWLELDLVGTTSNRDGVGARVVVTAGGVTQLREQNGGYHRWSQNDQRLHVGLAGNATADITIEWPSGTVDTFTNVAANALYSATEGGSLAPVTLGPPVFTTLEAGDECAEPGYDQDYGPAVLLWKDCSTGLWSLRAKGGRSTETRNFVSGSIRGDAPFADVAPFDLGADDSLDNTTPEDLLFSVGVWFSNDQGFDFNTAGQTESCFDPTTLDMPLIVGASGKRVEPPFDLLTLGECNAPPPDDPACGNPELDPGVDNELLIWRDCDAPGPDGQWIVRASSGGTGAGRYAGLIVSETANLSATPVFLEPNDDLDTTPGDGLLDFDLRLGSSGVDGFDFVLPAGADACFSAEDLPGVAEVRLGGDRLIKTGPFNLTTGATCNPSPPSSGPECGSPVIDLMADNELFIWRDCAAPGPDADWRVLVSSGGTGAGSYTGVLNSESSTLEATRVFLEPNDELDTQPGDGLVDFELKLGSSGVDGFDFTIPASTDACFDASQLAGTARVLLGEGRQQITGALDLNTLESCVVDPPEADPACGFPGVDPNTDNDLFIWRDCDAAGPGAQWNVRVSSGGVGAGGYPGTLTGSGPVLSANPVALEPNDTLDTVPGDSDVDFELKLGNSGIDGFTIAIPDGSSACFDAGTLPGTAQVKLGADRMVMGDAFDLATLEPCN